MRIQSPTSACAWCAYDAGVVAGGPLCSRHQADAEREAMLAGRTWAGAHARALEQTIPVDTRRNINDTINRST